MVGSSFAAPHTGSAMVVARPRMRPWMSVTAPLPVCWPRRDAICWQVRTVRSAVAQCPRGSEVACTEVVLPSCGGGEENGNSTVTQCAVTVAAAAFAGRCAGSVVPGRAFERCVGVRLAVGCGLLLRWLRLLRFPRLLRRRLGDPPPPLQCEAVRRCAAPGSGATERRPNSALQSHALFGPGRPVAGRRAAAAGCPGRCSRWS